MKLGLILLAGLVIAFAAEESCMDRCQDGFDSMKKCQCDTMCRYYQSCCSDYETICHKKTRGDTFEFAEDDDDPFAPTTPTPQTNPEAPIITAPVTEDSREERGPQRGQSSISLKVPEKKPLDPQNTTVPVTMANPVPTDALTTTVEEATNTGEPVATTNTKVVDPNADPCSGRPWDSFLQTKNGSVYAFRGLYVFKLDNKSVLPGYPKLIEDVWGIKGPIDAAFTRINCQGKTYIFKGNKYWRFDDGVLEEDFPKNISVGFDEIPDHLDAAFAIAAPGHHGEEKAYFFKGDHYYQYNFHQQPSHEECIKISATSPSALFTAYTDIYNDSWEELFNKLFRGIPNHHGGHRLIDKDWIGIKAPVDAVLSGRLYLTIMPLHTSSLATLLPLRLFDQQYGQQGQRGRDRQDRRRDRYNYDSTYNHQHTADSEMIHKRQPRQSVYFFKGDKYYRVDLKSKRVDLARPSYPRSIGKYWLGCPEKHHAAEKK
ncbi:hypothetical protein UPYG_G00199370 [Umbra pygmaea]|uniref:SMB domain-containing protein n=1 Tax=Umbra pygmaea TaxID=75934 RepID=A0ABD0X013_UMBPY